MDLLTPIEQHPLEPFLPENARVLFLGSFPPQRKRWCMPFFYPNYINDHWRIQGAVFHADPLHFVDAEHKCFRYEAVVEHARRIGIAYFDTATAVRRLADNASDKFLEVITPTDVSALFARLPRLQAVITTGELATRTLCTFFGVAELPRIACPIALPSIASGTVGSDKVIELYRLPSSSRAYPLAFSKKVEAYRDMFRRYGYQM